ncbi:unnamed protein product, partial [marine sediment metagenome]
MGLATYFSLFLAISWDFGPGKSVLMEMNLVIYTA